VEQFLLSLDLKENDVFSSWKEIYIKIAQEKTRRILTKYN